MTKNWLLGELVIDKVKDIIMSIVPVRNEGIRQTYKQRKSYIFC